MIKIIHLSDLHYRNNWEENQGVVLNNFFKDLEKQISLSPNDTFYLIMSGDFVLAGEDEILFDNVFQLFDSKLTKLNINQENRFCVPGNHDIERKFIKEKFVEHNGIVNSKLNEKDFNDYVNKPDNIFREKFHNYLSFSRKFSQPLSKDFDYFTGCGYFINEDISIYCLNTSICSSGGHNNIDDKGYLAIDTRNLQKWLAKNESKTKILVMHHPIEWLCDWAQEEVKIILKNHFNLCLYGHMHNQEYYHNVVLENSIIQCSAPPLFTQKKDQLGYSIISYSEKGPVDITYRQWGKTNNFLTGVDFSNTDDGKVIFNRIEAAKEQVVMDEILFMLDNDLNEALQSFAGQPIVWVDPIISKSNDIKDFNHAENKVPLEAIIITTDSLIINAPPLFGLTCLSKYLIKTAWQLNNDIWIYLDANIVRAHNLKDHISKQLLKRKCEIQNVKCVILDSWYNSDKEMFVLLKSLNEIVGDDIKIIIMHTIDDMNFLKGDEHEIIDRTFEKLHLLALPRGHVRKVVSQYNSKKHIGDEDSVISKVISDLDALNVHRTPMNCLTILKVSEKYYDESPVNRTKMLERILILLFELPEIPNYKSRPDVTDCEYVLGYFCEDLIRRKCYTFSRDDFSKKINQFSKEKLITIEDDLVFQILHDNNIIIKRDTMYVFRSMYWAYYFAAQRMHHSDDFANYMFSNKNYMAFPEIIEFYTGIDRRRENAIKILSDDLKSVCDIVCNKVGIEDGMNPYKIIKWEPTIDSLQRMQNLVGESVKNSGLPVSIKDEYADKTYDQAKPYNQTVNTIFEDYSLHTLMYSLKSASRALRNSDFVNPELKKLMLAQIIRSWEQVSKVLIALTPVLADQGEATFEGQGFALNGDFGDTKEEKINSILDAVPNNVVRFFKDDLFSNKLGALLFDSINNETNELKKLELILLIIYERPKNWKIEVQKYITSLNKNSFYLYKILRALNHEYKYSYSSPETLKEIAILIKVSVAKHQYGEMNPTKIAKIPNSVIPIREIKDDEDLSLTKYD